MSKIEVWVLILIFKCLHFFKSYDVYIFVFFLQQLRLTTALKHFLFCQSMLILILMSKKVTKLLSPFLHPISQIYSQPCWYFKYLSIFFILNRFSPVGFKSKKSAQIILWLVILNTTFFTFAACLSPSVGYYRFYIIK